MTSFKKRKKILKKISKYTPIFQALIIAVVGGVIAGIGSGLVVSGCESKRAENEQEEEVLFADMQNFGIACLFLTDVSDVNMPPMQYVVTPYFDNAGFIRSKGWKTQDLIHKNIVLMAASNEILEYYLVLDLEALRFDKMNNESQQLFLKGIQIGKEGIINHAEQIITNIKLYNTELVDLECPL